VSESVRHHRVVIIGAGFAGVGMAIKLKQEGERDFVVLEREARVGGTWYVNTYPGCACDVPSHLYSFSFAPNPNWSRLFAPQAEIRDYIERCCHDFDIMDHIRLNTTVTQMHWDASANLWRVHTTRGEQWTASVLLLAVGGLSRPKNPDLPGLERFRGTTFHSQTWDHSFPLAGKRVAVIGTGASAIQFVPQIQPQVASLDLYQRTPPWILPKADRALLRLEHVALRTVPGLQTLYRAVTYARLEARAFLFVKTPSVMHLVQKLAERHIRTQLQDLALREKVTPNYTIGCKRILISNDYYPAIAAANVNVINGIRAVTEDAIVADDGTVRPVDAIIFGTGFEATAPVPRNAIFGADGQDLVDAWPSGPEAYKGTTVSGFPNMFFLVGPNTGLGHNSIIYMIESQIAYVLGALRLMKQHGLIRVDVRTEVQAHYNATLQEKAKKAIWAVGGCKSWYVHQESGKNVTLWPDYTFSFRNITKHFDPDAYLLEPHTKVSTP
jgi:cation diffusion facilitator CzcD-associated flavoprotein CzcO